MANQQKEERQLGMTTGKARGLLVKMLLFEMAQKLGRDICFRCGQRIEGFSQISIEHKIAWLDSEDPAALYFDLSNIAFSHHVCNSKAGRKAARKADPGEMWCGICKKSRRRIVLRS